MNSDDKARDWLIGRMEYIQLHGDILIEAKDGEGYIVILNSDSEYDRETLGAFDTLAEVVDSINVKKDTTEAEELADHVRHHNIKGHSINADGSCNMGCC